MSGVQHSSNTTEQLCQRGPPSNGQHQTVNGGGGGGGGASYVFKVRDSELVLKRDRPEISWINAIFSAHSSLRLVGLVNAG